MTRSPTTCVHDFICFLLFILFLSMADGKQQLEDPSKDDFPNRQPAVSDGMNAENQPDLVEVTASRKHAWPEVVGLSVEEAEKRIKEDMPEARFQVVPQDGFVTMDFNEGRVRLFVDSSNKLAKAPRVG